MKNLILQSSSGRLALADRFPPFIRLALVGLLLGVFSVRADLTWNNGSGSGNWNTVDVNWTGFAWKNSAASNAVFTTVGGTVNLTQPITAGNVTVGNSSLNVPNTMFTNGSLNVSSLTVQGYSNNNGTHGNNPTLTLAGSTVLVSGNIAVGRANVVVTGGTVTANRIISSAASADWADFV
ncbi:MAG: hypothetical protein RLY20_574, partial [Verrucomicrobiota bacterium]